MDFDSILDEIGELGKFQLLNYALICFPVFFSAANSLSYVFTAGIPDYRCYILGCDEESPIFDSDWVPNIVPPDNQLEPHEKYKPAQCQMYSRKNNTLECHRDNFTDALITCNSWVYTDKERTIVNDWDITCVENLWKLSLIGTLHFAGIVCGSGLFGLLADRYGRKKVFIFCTIFMAATGVLQGLSIDYNMFSVFTFLNAVGTSGVYPLAFIIGVEMVGKKKREMSGMILNYFYALGEAALGLIAWLWPDWVAIQILISAPAFVFVAYYWLIPESVRWLMAKQKNRKAYKIIKKAAKFNKVTLSESVNMTFQSEKSASINNENNSEDDSETPEKVKLITLFRQALRSKIMIGRFFLIFYIWVTNAFIYYGLSLNSTSMSGNKYINFSLVCLIEIPGYTLAWISMNKIGRRWSLAGSLFLCTISCLGAAFIPFNIVWASILLSLLGKLGITSAFSIVYVYTAELLPTGIRSGGVGVASTLARFGAMVAPFVPLLGFYYKSLPLILFGFTSLIGTICALILPETLGTNLPDTVEEAERIGTLTQNV